jgi:DNA (cytosine-5)-methyltransferase 1
VFLVGHLGGPPARPVLFEREGGGGDPAPRGASRAIAAGEIARSVGGVGGGNDYGANKGTLIDTATTLKANTGRNHIEDTYVPDIVGQAMSAKWRKGASGPAGDEHHNLVVARTLGDPHEHTGGVAHDVRPEADFIVAHALTSGGADASEDGTGRGTPLVIGFAGHSSDNVPVDDLTPPVTTDEGGLMIAAPLTNGSHPNSSAPSRHREDDENLVMFVSENQRAEVLETDYARQLSSGGGKPGQGYPAVRDGASVRRLTPTECERLQGFPDGWTCLCDDPHTDDRHCPDGPRYAALGNAVTVNVAEAIGRWIP